MEPRHIEVQMHRGRRGQRDPSFERDWLAAARHQKVIEIAPAPNLDPGWRPGSAPTRRFARTHRLPQTRGPSSSLWTLAQPRVHRDEPAIQVEHTVTEEITDVDLVQSQLRIRPVRRWTIWPYQDEIRPRGAALQCRITTEDPATVPPGHRIRCISRPARASGWSARIPPPGAEIS